MVHINICLKTRTVVKNSSRAKRNSSEQLEENGHVSCQKKSGFFVKLISLYLQSKISIFSFSGCTGKI